MPIIYESTDRYTSEKYMDMGVEMNRVRDQHDMIRAQLNNEQFAQAFREVPA